jgi:hypothetical protein
MSISTSALREEALGRVLRGHGLICGALISAAGEVSRVGDYSTLHDAGLASALLGPLGAARKTFASLEGQLLPAIWAQGNTFAFVDRCGPELAVVVFGEGAVDASEQYQCSRRVAQAIAAEFSRIGQVA